MSDELCCIYCLGDHRSEDCKPYVPTPAPDGEVAYNLGFVAMNLEGHAEPVSANYVRKAIALISALEQEVKELRARLVETLSIALTK